MALTTTIVILKIKSALVNKIMWQSCRVDLVLKKKSSNFSPDFFYVKDRVPSIFEKNIVEYFFPINSLLSKHTTIVSALLSNGIWEENIFVIYSYEIIDDLHNNKSTLPKKADT